MIRKLLVANRGEIAVRAFRAAYELGIASVAVYAHEDRLSLHRQKADEAYEIGEHGHPVRAYLDVDGIVETALRVGADAVYPGYGFLSESPELAEACERNGIKFVGPPSRVLSLVEQQDRGGRGGAARGPARAALGDPGRRGGARGGRRGRLPAVREGRGRDGGGAGCAASTTARTWRPPSTRRAARQSAFGDPTVFLEQAVDRPRHIEVQILADGAGTIVHLRERDCSVQRRRQKVVEIAPAPRLAPEVAARLSEDAVKFAREIGYENAGTVEFLVDERGEHVFIEMNPRIQVEHTVTEEVTGVDLVQSQLRIAGGETLVPRHRAGERDRQRLRRAVPHHDRGPGERVPSRHREDLRVPVAGRRRGAARHRHRVRRRDRVPALRLAAGQADLPGPDVRGRGAAGAPGRRRVPHPRVASNIPSLQALLDEQDFRAGGVTTSYIADHPELLTARSSGDRATRLVRYLADVTVNKPHGDAPTDLDPATKLPPLNLDGPFLEGSRDRLLAPAPARSPSSSGTRTL